MASQDVLSYLNSITSSHTYSQSLQTLETHQSNSVEMTTHTEVKGHGTKNGPVFSNAMEALLHAHQNSVVMGLKDVAGVVQRMEIDDFIISKPDSFNLYMLALTEMQKEDYHKNPMSYNQIGGKLSTYFLRGFTDGYLIRHPWASAQRSRFKTLLLDIWIGIRC